ncbi:MAG: hypothetical protein WKF90_06235 [Pyrinomonadaceae bacterium]|jgi:hypothetical protein|nr:hypothetical protein [Acidobacteriota bacterium]
MELKIRASQINWDGQDLVNVYNQAVGKTIDEKIENKFNTLTIDGGTI